MESRGLFSELSMAPVIENFSLMAACAEDKDPQKVDLSLGAYRTSKAEPWVMPVVRQMRQEILLDEQRLHEYLPTIGQESFRYAGIRLLLGENSGAVKEKRVDATQTVGGTGSIRLGLEFLRRVLNKSTIYISRPAWSNYRNIARALGYESIVEYRYWNEKRFELDLHGLTEDFKEAPFGSVVVLQMCGHNPSGIDPSLDQWKVIADVCQERRLFVFFDCTYQGLASGDLDQDAVPLRYFVDQRFELLASQSFAKNFNLYNERVGQLIYVVNESTQLEPIRSHMEDLALMMWRSPSDLGSRIVSNVLNDQQRYVEWKSDLSSMQARILSMRRLLYEKIKSHGTPGSWEHLIHQTGLFFFSGLSKQHIEYLRSKYHIYAISDGRFNIAGLTPDNVEYVSKALHDAVTTLGLNGTVS